VNSANFAKETASRIKTVKQNGNVSFWGILKNVAAFEDFQ
jgi:hypothetical protein